MRTLILSVVLLSIACAVFGQTSAGGNWIGTWSNGKLGSGSLYICANQDTGEAYGSYGSVGLIAGSLTGNLFLGFWYEAGYSVPYGPFNLTINDAGTSFSGTWAYADGNSTKTWSGTKSSSAEPDAETQCLTPSIQGSHIQGVYDRTSYICDHSTLHWLNSNQSLYVGSFDGFGKIQGYSPDSGNTLSLSDFFLGDDDDASKYKPENFPIGGAVGLSSGADDDDSIFTQHIAIGRFVKQDTFCAWFWYGFYGHIVNPNVICFSRTQNTDVDAQACAFTQSDVQQIVHENDDGNTSQLIQNIQDAFDSLTLPEFKIDLIEGDNKGQGPPPNGKDVLNAHYVEDQPCTASGIFVSVAALIALVFAF